MKTAITLLIIFLILTVGFLVLLPFLLGIGGLSLGTAGLAPLTQVGGGDVLLISRNSGLDWEESTDPNSKSPRPPSSILDIQFHPRDAQTIYAGGHGSGFWVSKDLGKSWTKPADKNRVLDQRADIYAIDINASRPEVIYLAIFQKNKGRVLKSEDGGNSFREIYFTPSNRLGVFGVFSLPDNPERLFIITGNGGFFESQNGGKSWRVNKWFTEPLVKLVPNRAFPFEMYVATASGNIFKTFDFGENWADLNSDLSQFQGADKLETFFLDPVNFLTVYHGSSYGLLRSVNGGFNWTTVPVIIPSEALPVNTVATDPANSNIIYMSASSQLYKSEDGGENWSVQQLPTNKKIKLIKVYPKNTKILFAVLGR